MKLSDHLPNSLYLFATDQNNNGSFDSKQCLKRSLVQINHVLGSKVFPDDNIEKTLSCLHPEWHESSGEENELLLCLKLSVFQPLTVWEAS